MIHFALAFLCILSIELINSTKFFQKLNGIKTITFKVKKLIPSQKVSDHWKERAIPIYSLLLMRLSLQILFVLLLIISFFVTMGRLIDDFLPFIISFIGIIESLLLVYLYLLAKKFFFNG